MENREISCGYLKTRDILLTDSWIPEKNRPSLDDWEEIQGGRPEVKFNEDGRTFDIKHNYINKKDDSGTGVIVPASFGVLEGISENNLVRLNIKGREIHFPSVLLWEKYGKPSETLSLSMGGERYKRKKVKLNGISK